MNTSNRQTPESQAPMIWDLHPRQQIIFVAASIFIVFLTIIACFVWLLPFFSLLLLRSSLKYFLAQGFLFFVLGLIACASSTDAGRKLTKAFADIIWNGYSILALSATLSVVFPHYIQIGRSPTPVSGVFAMLQYHPKLLSALVPGLILSAGLKAAVSFYDLITSSPKALFEVPRLNRKR
ncbi:hypothetical protein [Acidocella facilis]|uniref:hypothetical protein n=1 Tax=Acidocella facilis TaxID=525 RepID=UPI001F3942A1|nr:hypothetical protein [Acidocella facilis]